MQKIYKAQAVKSFLVVAVLVLVLSCDNVYNLNLYSHMTHFFTPDYYNSKVMHDSDTITQILSYYQKIAKDIKEKNQRISFGYNSDIDIALNGPCFYLGIDLMKELKIKPKPKVYDEINTL
jgi:hypothetical protein